MKSEVNKLRDRLKKYKEFTARYRLAYNNLECKYADALSTLQTLSCKSVDVNSPAAWTHEQRMAWTAAFCLQSLASASQAKRPHDWEEPT